MRTKPTTSKDENATMIAYVRKAKIVLDSRMPRRLGPNALESRTVPHTWIG
jgi:hypothetical protein